MKRTRESVLRLPIERRAELAFCEAVDEVISEHARLGLPLYIGRNGKVVKLSPNKVRGRSRSNHHKSDSPLVECSSASKTIPPVLLDTTLSEPTLQIVAA